MLRFEGKMLIKHLQESRSSARRLTKTTLTKTGKDQHWKASAKGPVRSNAVQEAVGHSHFKLPVTLPQLTTQ